MVPGPDRGTPLTGDALDAEIVRLEHALVDRQHRFVARATALGQRAQHAIAHPFGDGLMAGLGMSALSWLFRPSRPARDARRGGDAALPAPGGWGRWLALLWPMVPANLRARVDPRVFAIATTLGIPLLERLLASRRRRRGMALAGSTDRDRDPPSPAPHREVKPMRTLFLTAALTVLMLRTMSLLGRTHRGRLAAKPQAKPEPLQRWEGEGGNLPVVPKTVNPAIVPADQPV